MKTFKEFLNEGIYKKSSSKDRIKGESYVVYDTRSKKIVKTDDNKILSGITRDSAKSFAKENDNYKVASSSWANDNGIK